MKRIEFLRRHADQAMTGDALIDRERFGRELAHRFVLRGHMALLLVAVILSGVVASKLLLLLANTLFAQPAYDLLLKGAHVIDPKNKISSVRDVAIRDQHVLAFERALQRHRGFQGVVLGLHPVEPAQEARPAVGRVFGRHGAGEFRPTGGSVAPPRVATRQ